MIYAYGIEQENFFFFLLRIYAKIHDCAVVGWAAFNFEKKIKYQNLFPEPIPFSSGQPSVHTVNSLGWKLVTVPNKWLL